jgi:hypothetical protein
MAKYPSANGNGAGEKAQRNRNMPSGIENISVVKAGVSAQSMASAYGEENNVMSSIRRNIENGVSKTKA